MASSSLIPERNQRIIDAGKALYGELWQRRLALKCGLSQQYVNFIARGSRPVTDDVDRKVADALKRESKRLYEVQKVIERARALILRDLGTR